MKKQYYGIFCVIFCTIPSLTGTPGRLRWCKKYQEIQTELVQFFEQKKTNKNATLIKEAKKGRLSSVKVLVSKYKAVVSQEALIAALRGRHQDVTQYLHKQTLEIDKNKFGYVFRLACKNGFVRTARILHNDWYKLPKKKQEEFHVDEMNGFALRLSLVNSQKKSIKFLLREVGAIPHLESLSKKQTYELLSYYAGIEEQFKQTYKYVDKDSRKNIKTAWMEYCLRGRLIQKWIDYWLARNKNPKQAVDGVIFNILKISGY